MTMLDSETPRRRPISDVMTKTPHSIGADQTLEYAGALMRKFGIRHLPVLRGGKLVGMLSQRDVYLVETLRGVDPHLVMVSEAMSEETYQVTPATDLADVLATMQRRKLGSTVVVDGKAVVGIFTTVDAVRLLSELVGERALVA